MKRALTPEIRRRGVTRVLAPRWLDLDYVRPDFTEHSRHRWTGDVRRHVDHSEIGEPGCVHFASPADWSDSLPSTAKPAAMNLQLNSRYSSKSVWGGSV